MRLLYFAWVRAKIGCGEESVTVPADVRTVADLVAWLKTRGPGYVDAFANPNVIRAAVNQKHVDWRHPVADADEVALFPPVTGG